MRIIFTLILIFLLTKSYSQVDTLFQKRSHSFGFSVGNIQIKEGLNLGLVFGGTQFDFQYGYLRNYKKYKFIYETAIGIGILKSRQMEGFNIRFKPLDFSYLHLVKHSTNSQFYFGGNILLNYNYQLYPDFQSGQSYWLSQIQLKPKIEYSRQLRKNKIEVQFENSLFGFISRPPIYRDPHFFEINVDQFITNANSNFKVGSFNQFNSTNFKLKYVMQKRKVNYVIGYEFYYLSYYQSPNFELMSHSLLLQIQLKKK